MRPVYLWKTAAVCAAVCTAAGLSAAVNAGPKAAAQAPPAAKGDPNALKVIHDQIMRDGKLPGGDAYWQRVKLLHGPDRLAFSATVLGTQTRTGSQLYQLQQPAEVGRPPEGFGHGFHWDRKDDQIRLVLFINAADTVGVCIDGVQDGDMVHVTSAAGLCYFDKDKGNPRLASLVGLVAAGAQAGAAAYGVPEAAPLIAAAEKFAAEQFKGTGEKKKPRDPFGVDPGSGHKARNEGGVVVCMPADGGPVYSGKRGRRITKNADRTDHIRPPHFKYGYFLQREPDKNVRTASDNGQMYVLAWDFAFEDNAGYYKVFLHIKKGPPPNSGPIVK
jgi:hypothetical protein